MQNANNAERLIINVGRLRPEEGTMLPDEKMYEIMRAVEKRLDDRGLPKVMVNTVIFLNEMGHLQEAAQLRVNSDRLTPEDQRAIAEHVNNPNA